MFTLWLMGISFVALVTVYFAFVRPMLRRWAALQSFWVLEAGFFEKVRLFFEGIKIKLLARLVWVPAALAMGYDKFTELCSACDLTPITAQLPSWAQSALPLVSALVVPILIDWARSYSSTPAS